MNAKIKNLFWVLIAGLLISLNAGSTAAQEPTPCDTMDMQVLKTIQNWKLDLNIYKHKTDSLVKRAVVLEIKVKESEGEEGRQYVAGITTGVVLSGLIYIIVKNIALKK